MINQGFPLFSVKNIGNSLKNSELLYRTFPGSSSLFSRFRRLVVLSIMATVVLKDVAHTLVCFGFLILKLTTNSVSFAKSQFFCTFQRAIRISCQFFGLKRPRMVLIYVWWKNCDLCYSALQCNFPFLLIE